MEVSSYLFSGLGHEAAGQLTSEPQGDPGLVLAHFLVESEVQKIPGLLPVHLWG